MILLYVFVFHARKIYFWLWLIFDYAMPWLLPKMACCCYRACCEQMDIHIYAWCCFHSHWPLFHWWNTATYHYHFDYHCLIFISFFSIMLLFHTHYLFSLNGFINNWMNIYYYYYLLEKLAIDINIISSNVFIWLHIYQPNPANFV